MDGTNRGRGAPVRGARTMISFQDHVVARTQKQTNHSFWSCRPKSHSHSHTPGPPVGDFAILLLAPKVRSVGEMVCGEGSLVGVSVTSHAQLAPKKHE